MVNNADNDGLPPLMVACKRRRIKSVLLLLEEQRNQLSLLDPKDKDFKHYESFYNYMNSVGPYKNQPLHYACKTGNIEIVQALVEAGAELNGKNFYNDTPLSIAAIHGHLDIVKYLVEKGANIHGVDKQQRSPFIRACMNGQVHIVAYLLKMGVNPNFCDSSENTGLHYACAYGWLNVVKLLIEHGNADANRLNEWKSSPTIIAMLKGHLGIVDYMLSLKNINSSLVDD